MRVTQLARKQAKALRIYNREKKRESRARLSKYRRDAVKAYDRRRHKKYVQVRRMSAQTYASKDGCILSES